MRAVLALVLGSVLGSAPVSAQEHAVPELRVKFTEDFTITSDATAPAWDHVPWTAFQRRANASHDYDARFKMLYSKTGVYVLFDGSDQRLTASLTEDFANLWTEDVYEVFFWPDEKHPVYFEYEISPLGYELPILVPNFDGKFLGWRPWNYDGERRTRRAIRIEGGPQQSGAAIQRWSAEVFIPYNLLKPLPNVPPKPGTRWRANVYRVDYDADGRTQWDWARVGPSFHEYQKFGVVIFE